MSEFPIDRRNGRVAPRGVGRSHLFWPGFFAFVLAAWAALAAMSVGHPGPSATLGPGMGIIDRLLGDPGWGAFLENLCTTAAGTLSLPALFGMWALMTLAMMAPTALPFFSAYRNLVNAKPGAAGVLALPALVLGYLGVWLAFSFVAATAQIALTGAGAVSDAGISTSMKLNTALLLVAGLYQFAPMKRWALKGCRTPMNFFLTRWRHGTAGAWTMGLEQGLMCFACCWALMLLAFAGGTMNLLWMGGAMLVMALEKMPEIGEAISAPLGVFLIYGSVLTGALAFGLI